ncbi:MAG: hypothetical protein ACLGIV_07075 [Actinomycetes bacterium]
MSGAPPVWRRLRWLAGSVALAWVLAGCPGGDGGNGGVGGY